jgi:Kef-type K+ transport system membrane component KefB
MLAVMTTFGLEQYGVVFLMFAVILLAAMVSSVVERFGQPLVVGQLLAGIALSACGYFGWGLMREAGSNSIIAFLAAFGSIILLLSAGMESKVRSLAKVGLSATAVAAVGVAIPFFVGAFVLGPWFFPNDGTNSHLFFGAALVATSVGISTAIFKALSLSHSRAAQTVLAAAVFDDILGLVILAVVTEIVLHGSVDPRTIAWQVIKLLVFLFGALAIGRYLAPFTSKIMSKLNHVASTKLVLAVVFALILGYLGQLVGLQPIIGAFAAGLLLSGISFDDYDEPEIIEDLIQLKQHIAPIERAKLVALIAKHRRSHLGGMIDTLGAVSVPVFFVYTGLQLDFGSLLQPQIYAVAILITVVAVFGKVLAGFVAKGSLHERLVVGFAMVPRGEVGLIFAATAKGLGVFSSVMYSTTVLVIILTPLVAPPVLARLLGVRR